MNSKSRSGVKPKLFAGLILVYGGHRLITMWWQRNDEDGFWYFIRSHNSNSNILFSGSHHLITIQWWGWNCHANVFLKIVTKLILMCNRLFSVLRTPQRRTCLYTYILCRFLTKCTLQKEHLIAVGHWLNIPSSEIVIAEQVNFSCLIR